MYYGNSCLMLLNGIGWKKLHGKMSFSVHTLCVVVLSYVGLLVVDDMDAYNKCVKEECKE